MVRNFVEKSSIILLNSKPSNDEIQKLCSIYTLYDSFVEHKKNLVDSFMRSSQFAKSIFDQFRFEYIQGVDLEQIDDAKTIYKAVQSKKSQPQYYDFFVTTYLKLVRLSEIEDDIHSGKITIALAQRYFLDNNFYDNANMGEDNYVTSTFNYLLFRLPTKYELEEAKKILDKTGGTLFMQANGKSKDDYLDILFASKPYIEGQIRYWYNKLLDRDPTLGEIMPYLKMGSDFTIEKVIEQTILSDGFTILSNENDLKSKRKSPMSFIGIGYEDVYGSPMDISSQRQMEQSYNAWGDHNIIENMLTQSILKRYSNSGSSGIPGQIDSGQLDYYGRIADCPAFGGRRAKDPLLMCISVIFSYTEHSIATKASEGMLEAYNKYLAWQKQNSPHSPWALNEPPSYLNGNDKLRWEIEYTENWVRTYPGEYCKVLDEYEKLISVSAPETAKLSGKNLNKEFMTFLLNKLDVRVLDVMTILKEDNLRSGSAGEMDTQSKKLKDSPKEFVDQLYENMLMRHPSAEEEEGLLKIIRENPGITPEVIYYSLMTSPEYKYY